MSNKTYKVGDTYYCSVSSSYSNGKCSLSLHHLNNLDKISFKGRCVEKKVFDFCPTSSKINLSEGNYNFNLALMGNFIGFSFTFLLLFLAVLVMRR